MINRVNISLNSHSCRFIGFTSMSGGERIVHASVDSIAKVLAFSEEPSVKGRPHYARSMTDLQLNLP